MIYTLNAIFGFNAESSNIEVNATTESLMKFKKLNL
jgi:hypothetical protein